MDVERLIQCVRQHVYLYDISHRDYKNVNLKNATWESIAEELNQTSEAIKQKWKTVKDNYIKYKKQLKIASSTGKNVIDYVWSSHLKFLDSYHASRKSDFNVITQAAFKSFPASGSESPPPIDILMHSLQSSSNYLQVEPMQTTNNTQTPTKRRKKNETTDDNNHQLITRNHDAIDFLFLSYAQTFKKFAPRQQALLKMELAKLFANAELDQLETSNLESATAFACVPPVLSSDNVTSPAHSTSSSGSNEPLTTARKKKKQPIKEERTDNPFSEEFSVQIGQ